MNITGTGSAVPALKITNDMLSMFLDTSDEWIRTRTGILERGVAVEECEIENLAVDAANKAMEDAGICAEDIDLILCSTVIPPYITPAFASIIQGRIGAKCPSVDLNAACAGFIYALDMAEAYIASKKAEKILILCAEHTSRLPDWTDRATCVLFGDGAGAVIVEQGDGVSSLQISCTPQRDMIVSHIPRGNCPYVKNEEEGSYLQMRGQDVFRFAVTSATRNIEQIMQKNKLTPDDISYFILHQANLRIIQAIRQRFRQPEEKFPHNIEHTGNTSSASIPILLDEMAKNGQLKQGDKLILSAFGAGLVTGVCMLEWQK